MASDHGPVLFASRLRNLSALTDPGSDSALIDNLHGCIDRISGIAGVLLTAEYRTAEIPNGSITEAARAILDEIKNAEELVDVWYDAKTKREKSGKAEGAPDTN